MLEELIRTLRPRSPGAAASAPVAPSGPRAATIDGNVAPAAPGAGIPIVCLVDTDTCAAYDEFVARHRDGSFYHTLAWRAALQAAGCGAPVYLMALDLERVTGIFPLVRTRDARGVERLESLPGSPIGGPLALDDVSAWLLHSSASRLAGAAGTALLIREFGPVTSSNPAEPLETWMRVPNREFYNCAHEVTPGAGDSAELRTVPLDARWREAFAPSTEWPDVREFLRTLGASCELRCTLQKDDVSWRPLGTWFVRDRVLVLLATAPAAATPEGAAALLRHVSEQARATGATVVDLAPGCTPAGWHERLRRCPGIQVSGATTLDDTLPKCYSQHSPRT